MQIVYDHQIFQYQRFGGISRYFAELIRQFQVYDDVEIITPFTFIQNEYLLGMKGNFIYSNPMLFGDMRLPGKTRMNMLRDKLFPRFNKSQQNVNSILNTLRKRNFDIFHPTYYDCYYLDELKEKKLIITVYDLIYEKFTDQFYPSEAIEVLQNKKKLIEQSDHIIVLSESGKKDLLELYHINPNKVSVVSLGNSLTLDPDEMSISKQYNLPQKYILFVGLRFGYKNFQFFIESIQEILRNDDNLFVVCTGKEFSPEEIKIFRQLKIEKKVLQRFVRDSELAVLYKHAAAFVFPSLYEGFGIPVLEAMSIGCPAVLSNTSSLPEVGGDAALYFDPRNAQSIANSVSECLNDENKRISLIEKGRERVNNFSWQKTAQGTAEVYRNVLRDH
jgi:glycosyltransferase involved in cell wall biosynthesis